jgi:hypothetical protein
MKRATPLRLAPILVIILTPPPQPLDAQETDHAACPMHAAHAAKDVDRRGDQVMGFAHSATTHHFRLTKDGGAIEIAANDAGDSASVAAIRSHLTAVAEAFGRGDFAMPEAIHGELPPGAETLAARRAELDYRYEETAAGARVRILARTPESLAAVYEFLRYQIAEHRTGDSREPAS